MKVSNKLRFGVAACSLLTAAVAGVWFAGYRVNMTESFPRGLWRVTEAPAEKGALVLFCPSDAALFARAREAGYLAYGLCQGGYAPLIKRVAAVAGDRVSVTKAGLAINGVPQANSRKLAADSTGQGLPQAALPDVVPFGHVLLLSDYNARSYDSRYFGAIPTARIQGVVVPILTEDNGGLS